MSIELVTSMSGTLWLTISSRYQLEFFSFSEFTCDRLVLLLKLLKKGIKFQSCQDSKTKINKWISASITKSAKCYFVYIFTFYIQEGMAVSFSNDWLVSL